MQFGRDPRGTVPLEPLHAEVYRYCLVLACGDVAVARDATLAVRDGAGDDAAHDRAAVFALARAAVKAGLRERGAAPDVPAEAEPARALYAARPALEEQHWNLLALLLPRYAQRPRHGQVDLADVATVTGKKVDVTRKAVDRLLAPGGYLELALFTAGAVADGGGFGCPQLAAVVADGTRLRPALRKAVAAHLSGCDACTTVQKGRPAALAVLRDAPIPSVPPELTAPDDEPPHEYAPEPGGGAAAHASTVDGAETTDTVDGPETKNGDNTTNTVDGAATKNSDDTEDTVDGAGTKNGAGTEDTVELMLQLQPDRAPATVYHPLPAVARLRPPLLRRPPVLIALIVVLLAVAAGTAVLAVRSGPATGLSRAAQAPPASAGAAVTSPQVLPPPGVARSGSPGASRTPAASAHARTSADVSALPAGPVSADGVAPLLAAGDRLREVLPLQVQTPRCPGQTFEGSCYSVEPFTLPLSVAVPAGFDEAPLADALQWTVRAQTLLGPVEFHGRGNHARVTVTDGGQATPPTVWTLQAALSLDGETHLSDEVTLRVYATTT